ncbi:MAG TPA: succinate dehydrogenase, hydrophobic membrane anchor protein [Sulfuriferula sp.]|nr:succinate dehydrogenase, hydrophobic membrane anchor protein [Sulfuriferula sp.]
MVGGALSAWLVQRLSALLLAAYSLLFPVWVALHWPLDFAVWRGLFAPLPMRITTLLFVVALALHAWVGMRDIFMDYVQSLGLRLALHVGALLWLAACVVWAGAILWRLP